MMFEQKFSVEDETKILPSVFWEERRSTQHCKIQRRGVEQSSRSRKIEHFSFSMFYNKTKLCEKNRGYIVTTKKIHIQNRDRFVLRDEKTIVNKR